MEIILIVGPCGSGKTTLSRTYLKHVRINQDELGSSGHLDAFDKALKAGKDIVIDRMGFSKVQRERYLKPAKEAGYNTKIIVLHENYAKCLERMIKREDHETIKNEETARKVLNHFFSKYERVEDSEADEVQRKWPEGNKPLAVICDLDGTLCNIDHRLHFVRGPEKKNWVGFQENLIKDKMNEWCYQILSYFQEYNKYIVLCSGRTNNYRELTRQWLEDNYFNSYDNLFMRYEGDYRQDYIAKEILLEFEVKTRYTPYFFIDDRQQVVDLYRKHGYTVLQCAKGNF